MFHHNNLTGDAYYNDTYGNFYTAKAGHVNVKGNYWNYFKISGTDAKSIPISIPASQNPININENLNLDNQSPVLRIYKPSKTIAKVDEDVELMIRVIDDSPIFGIYIVDNEQSGFLPENKFTYNDRDDTYRYKISYSNTGTYKLPLIALIDDWNNITYVDVEKYAEGKFNNTITIADEIIPVTGLTLNQTSLILTEGGEKGKLVATVMPENATNKRVKWTSSNANVANVDGNGVVTPLTLGTATITVTTEDGNKTATCLVTVKSKDVIPPAPPIVNTVNDNDTKITGTAEVGSTITVKAGDQMVMLGTTKVGTDGVFSLSITPQKAGTVLYVTAIDQAGNESEVSKVIVKDVTSPASPTVNEVTEKDTKVTGSAEVGSTITVKTGDRILGTGTVGSLGAFGVPIPIQKVGTVLYVTATDQAGNVSEATKVIVKRKEVVNLTISMGKVEDIRDLAMPKGTSQQLILTATYEDKTKEDVTKMATWTSKNPAVALVEEGFVTTNAQGKTTITAEYKDKRVALTVEVNLKGLVATIDDVVIKKSLSIKPNSEQQIRLKADHGDGKLLDVPAEEAKWYSNNPEIASVDEKGIITTTTKPGKAIITVEFEGKKANIPVEIKLKNLMATVEGESVKSLNLETGDQVKITLTAIYADRESTSLDVTNETEWKSSKAAIAAVDASGNVTALAKGKAIITGKFGGKTVTVTVNVK